MKITFYMTRSLHNRIITWNFLLTWRGRIWTYHEQFLYTCKMTNLRNMTGAHDPSVHVYLVIMSYYRVSISLTRRPRSVNFYFRPNSTFQTQLPKKYINIIWINQSILKWVDLSEYQMWTLLITFLIRSNSFFFAQNFKFPGFSDWLFWALQTQLVELFTRLLIQT